VQRCLSTSNWSMGEALKEPYPMPTTPPAQPAPQVVVAPTPTPTPTPTPAPPAAPAPAAGPVMLVASSSRFIALVGLVVMVGLYLSFGCLIVISVASGHDFPAWGDKAGTYMLTGLTLFAPYGVNKLSSIGK